MKNALKSAASMAALSLVLGGCMSAPTPSPRLLAAEATLMQAKANPATFESGRAALDKADIAMKDARTFYMKREDDDYVHAIRMGEGYVALAQARGDQLEANRKIASLNKDRADVVADARTRQVKTAEAATAVAQAQTAEAEVRANQSAVVAAAAVADSAAATKAQLAAEDRAAAMKMELASYEQKKTDLGVTLILRDLQFASASAKLTKGAEGRLAPLAAFLARQPDAKIQITGHTDAQGPANTNLALSTRRAEAVGAYLNSTGVSTSRIMSTGKGEAIPVATNDTAAGRAINRRVEVTILN